MKFYFSLLILLLSFSSTAFDPPIIKKGKGPNEYLVTIRGNTFTILRSHPPGSEELFKIKGTEPFTGEVHFTQFFEENKLAKVRINNMWGIRKVNGKRTFAGQALTAVIHQVFKQVPMEAHLGNLNNKNFIKLLRNNPYPTVLDLQENVSLLKASTHDFHFTLNSADQIKVEFRPKIGPRPQILNPEFFESAAYHRYLNRAVFPNPEDLKDYNRLAKNPLDADVSISKGSSPNEYIIRTREGTFTIIEDNLTKRDTSILRVKGFPVDDTYLEYFTEYEAKKFSHLHISYVQGNTSQKGLGRALKFTLGYIHRDKEIRSYLAFKNQEKFNKLLKINPYPTLEELQRDIPAFRFSEHDLTLKVSDVGVEYSFTPKKGSTPKFLNSKKLYAQVRYKTYLLDRVHGGNEGSLHRSLENFERNKLNGFSCPMEVIIKRFNTVL